MFSNILLITLTMKDTIIMIGNTGGNVVNMSGENKKSVNIMNMRNTTPMTMEIMAMGNVINIYEK